MAAFVIDSSLALAWCFADERTDYTNAVLRTLASPAAAVAPRLWAYEVRNIVLMGFRRKRITKIEAEKFLDSIQGLPIRLTDPFPTTVFSTWLAGRPPQPHGLRRRLSRPRGT